MPPTEAALTNSPVMFISLIDSWTCFSNDFLNSHKNDTLLFNVKKPSCETEDVHYSFNMGSVRGNHIPRTFRSVSSQMGLIIGSSSVAS